MNILIQLSHPAHFHLYKNVARNLMNDGNRVYILIKTKDILEDLLKQSGLPYYNILKNAHRKSKLGVILDMFVREVKMIRFVYKHKIDLLTGSTPEVAHVSLLARKYGLNTGEDDIKVIPAFAKMVYPFAATILSPVSCDNGKFEKKTIKYASYHELAYLHPNNFVAQKEIARKYVDIDRPYFILRFAKLNAHHDDGIHGINTAIAQRLLDVLLPHGNVYITAERELEPQFEKYRIHIKTIDMHHVMAYADMYVGDSQTMAEEAAMLGVPFVRFNGFVGRIGCLEELEQNGYKLGYGVKPENEELLYSAVNEILSTPNRYEVYQKRRQKLLADKIDYAAFLTWFIENYPESREIMKINPDYQYRFR